MASDLHIESLRIDEEIEDRAQTQVDNDSVDIDKKKIGYKKTSPFSLENIAWIIAAVVVCYYTDFFKTILYDDRIDTSWMHATILCFAVLMFVTSYLILYVYMIKHIDPDDWDKMYPSAIPCASASAVLFGICLTVSVWPVWGVMSLPILFILFMAFICGICMLDVFKVLCKKYEDN